MFSPLEYVLSGFAEHLLVSVAEHDMKLRQNTRVSFQPTAEWCLMLEHWGLTPSFKDFGNTS